MTEKVIKERIVPKSDLIKAIYLCGSFTKGKEKAKSDTDLAFVFHEKFSEEDPFNALLGAELLSVKIY